MRGLSRVRLFNVRVARLAAAIVMMTLGATAALAQSPKSAPPEIPPPKEEPRSVRPGQNGGAPSDAIVLFDGKDLSKWESADGQPAKWRIDQGALVVAPKTGDIRTKEKFGDCQLHIEWATPSVVQGEGQGRGNSGVYLQNRYEIQVLDSYQNKTYFHGQAGSLYKQYAPLVNVTRPPGEWQTYDIVFRAPRFGADGEVQRPGSVSVFHNGVLVQDHVEIKGSTTHEGGPVYEAHGPDSIKLQDHGNETRFRNIWIRKLN